MSETQEQLNNGRQGCSKQFTRLLWVGAVAAIIIYLIARNIGVFGNVLVVAIGFGAVVLVHEFGHFVVAKLSDIKVEAFSIGFPPVLAGIQRMANGWRIRVLPDMFKNKEGQLEALFSFNFGGAGKAGETEYQIGLIPFGGFVKMLGQEDMGTAKSTDDPRSYVNKPVGSRMAVITAGVTFNIISAVIVFMTVFLIGIELQPPVVGSVVADSPAARAGLKAGDEIIAIGDKKKNIDFGDIKTAAALSGEAQEIAMMVRHEDGSESDYKLVAEKITGEPMKDFGIISSLSLSIAQVSDAEQLYAQTGFKSGDRITAADGTAVRNYGQLAEVVSTALSPQINIEAERLDEATGQTVKVESRISLDISAAGKEVESESDLSQVCSIVPRLKITEVLSGSGEGGKKLQKGDIILTAGEEKLKKGDIILAAGEVENPTYKELRDVTTAHEDKTLAIKVLRAEPNGVEKTPVVTVKTKRVSADRVVIGIAVALDAAHPVVAKTVKTSDGPEPLAIPRGATITSVNGMAVSNFYDIIRQVRQAAGGQIAIAYLNNEQAAGEVVLDTASVANLIAMESVFGESVPLEELKRLYKASGPLEAVAMGYNKTLAFVAQTYVTLKRLVSGLVSPKELMGPVGIVTFSYRIVSEQPLIYYVYFLGLISACIAVFNFLPLPPLDGGHIVLLTIEKIKGSALGERTIGIIAYAGWVVIGSFFLYVTFNDVVRSFFSK